MNMAVNIHSISEAREARMGPQVEDGYTRIADELLDAVMSAPFTSREYKVVLAVFRLTYGWSRKEARITTATLETKTGLPATTASKVLSSLISRNIIHRSGGSRSPISVNKHYEDWVFEGKKQSFPEPKSKQSQLGQNSLAKLDQNSHTINRQIDINTSSLRSDVGASGQKSPKPDAEKPKKKSSLVYTPEFELAWSKYPRRSGSNPKPAAFKSWRARLADGVEVSVMIAGIERYAAFVTAKGNLNTEYVMQAQRFFGTNREFENDWAIPQQINKPRSTPGMHTNLPDFSNVQIREDGTCDF